MYASSFPKVVVGLYTSERDGATDGTMRWTPMRRAQHTDESNPQPPKRAMTAYLIFCSKHRGEIMRQIHPEPNAKFTRAEMHTVTTKLAAMWKKISPSERKQVQAEADKCKATYEMQKAAFPPAMLKKLARAKNKPKGQIVIEAQGEKPVRARTAYLIFCSKYRRQVMAEIHPNENEKFTRDEMQAVTTKLADMWNKITPAELKSCKEQAAKELAHYRKLKAEYRPPVYGPAKKSKPSSKAINANGKPKKPPTAYLLFAEERRNQLKKSEPQLNHVDISRRVADDWKQITAGKREEFQKKANRAANQMAREAQKEGNAAVPQGNDTSMILSPNDYAGDVVSMYQ